MSVFWKKSLFQVLLLNSYTQVNGAHWQDFRVYVARSKINAIFLILFLSEESCYNTNEAHFQNMIKVWILLRTNMFVPHLVGN